MKIHASQSLKFRLVNFIDENPSGLRISIITSFMFVMLMLMAVPLSVVREIVFGSSPKKADLKTSLRSMIWLWNRSWIPVKPEMGTYFDIGWNLSAESCQALSRRRFVDKSPLKKKCDVAQLKLSVIRDCIQAEDIKKLAQADEELISLVGCVFETAYKWAASVESDEAHLVEAAPVLSGKVSALGKDFNDDATRGALLDLDDLCTALGQEYFLVSGTFLGVVRDGAFIGHDHDIDVGVFEDKLLEELLPALREADVFDVNKVDHICMRKVNDNGIKYDFMEKPAIIKLIHKSGIVIDIFIHFYDTGVMWHGSSVHRWNNKNFELKNYEFLGRLFKGADDFDLYLSENYGEDWRTPKPDFNSSIDTPNLSFVGTANSLVYFAWVIAKSVAENNPIRVREYLNMLSSLGALEVEGSVIRVK